MEVVGEHSMSRYIHWRCPVCGVYGSSTSREAEQLLVDRHRRRGHPVEVWVRGHRDKASLLPPIVEPDADVTIEGGTNQ